MQPVLPQPLLRSRTSSANDRAALLSALVRLKLANRREALPAAAANQTTVASVNPQDRRAYPRRESGCQVAICRRPAEGGMNPQQVDWALHAAEVRGRLVDVSMSGLALELPQAIEARTRVFLRVLNRSLDRRIDTIAEILRCTSAGTGQWNIICRLEKNLTFEQLHYLGKHLFASTIV